MTEVSTVHTCVLYLKEHTYLRVQIDRLDGPPDEAIAAARNILGHVGRADPENVLVRVIDTQEIDDVDLVPPSLPET